MIGKPITPVIVLLIQTVGIIIILIVITIITAAVSYLWKLVTCSVVVTGMVKVNSGTTTSSSSNVMVLTIVLRASRLTGHRPIHACTVAEIIGTKIAATNSPLATTVILNNNLMTYRWLSLMLQRRLLITTGRLTLKISQIYSIRVLGVDSLCIEPLYRYQFLYA